MKFPDLNPQQKLAVQAPDKPLLIVAGAGTGKTRTLTSRILYLIREKGVPADQIIALTFTNKAAREMAERIKQSEKSEFHANDPKKFNSGVPIRQGFRILPFIGTFHSLGAKILRAEARALGRTAGFGIFDDSDSLQIIKKIGKKTGLFVDRRSTAPGPIHFSQKISRIKNGVVELHEFESSSRTEDQLVFSVFELYEKELENHNAFDFDDLIEKVVEIFKKQPSVLKKYRTRFRYLLIDEYQDLNNVQYELVRLLAGRGGSVSVVGDDQQSIYAFRGSNFELFLNFERDWPDATVVMLEENYRSTANIIQAASGLIQHNIHQKPKQLWTKNETGSALKIIEAADENKEAAWIAEEVYKLKSLEVEKLNKDDLPTYELKNLPTIAVLYRTNAQSRVIEQELLERDIPYQIFGGLRFYERREIKDIIAALRYAQNPRDSVSSERLEKSLYKTRFVKFKESLADARAESPPELIDIFLKATGYFELIERNFSNAEDRRENIAELLHFASQFKDLPLFLEHIALLQPADQLAKGKRPRAYSKDQRAERHTPQAMCQLMTIHLAKGLEFDTVFVAGCSEGLLPHNRSLRSAAEIEEERRLLYVAMTRARKELSLSFFDIPSRFLGELPPELTTFESLSADGRRFSDLDNEERYITLD